MAWKLWKSEPEEAEDSVRSEQETLDRIEAVTARLEWLAGEIEQQLEKTRSRGKP